MPIREKLHLSAGYGFEVAIEDEDTITLRRIPQPANRGLVDLLLACPAPFEIPRGTPRLGASRLVSYLVDTNVFSEPIKPKPDARVATAGSETAESFRLRSQPFTAAKGTCVASG